MALPHLHNLDARLAALLATPQLMGIVNVTPNSFSDGGMFLDPAAAVAHARQLAADGAAFLDLGAEASSFFRPGVTPVDPEEQLRRLLPVIVGLRDARAILSVDTRSAAVARDAIAAGAHLINDISAGTHDPAMLEAAAELGVPIILMHISPGYPESPKQDDPDIAGTVAAYLNGRADAALAAGIAPARIWLDPGVGFGKTPADNWRLVDQIDRLLALGHPVVLGASRKRFLAARQLPTPLPDWLAAAGASHERDPATALLTAQAARGGVPVQRVHNVALCARALRPTEPTKA